MIGTADFLLRFLEDEGVLDGQSSCAIGERARTEGVDIEDALQEGMRPMYRDGLDKARIGITTLGEAVRVAPIMSHVGDRAHTSARTAA